MADKSKRGKEAITLGTVVSIDDPTFTGRIKVQVPGYNDNIEVEKLPWCSYGGSEIFSGNGGGSISIARVGQKVRVRFKSSEGDSMEWYAINNLDPDLVNELKNDYENSCFLLYDSGADISIKYQPVTGMVAYFAGSYIQIAPDNSITIHYGMGATGTQIQLSDGCVDIQGSSEINLSSSGTINLDAQNIILNGKGGVQIKGSVPGECAINGANLITALMMLATSIDAKTPQSVLASSSYINSMKEGILNQNVKFI